MSKYPENWEKDCTPRVIKEKDRIPKTIVIGNLYHCSWANNACVWKLINILPNNKVVLETPRTKRQIITNQSDLRLTNKEIKKNIYKNNY